MKINCDVCNKDEASVFCSADDAALCTACDHRVHHANILAGKHPRFSLTSPSPNDSPICDICQEKKALLFCQQDRAILCKVCDVAIHKVNEHTMNHGRFLLTGIKLSPVALLPTTGNNDIVHNQKPNSQDQQEPVVDETWSKTQKITTNKAPKSNGSGYGRSNSSSISEYLIEMLPGWHVEDFLDSPPILSEGYEDDQDPFWDDEVLKGHISNDCFSSETMGIWVPQAPPPPTPPPLQVPPQRQPCHHNHNIYDQLPPYNSNMRFGNDMISPTNPNHKITKSNEKRRSDDGNCFAVPQMGPPTLAKRSRMLR
ncbi:B-box zinc finger protein 20-like [Rutidosis leptorrhynchoides]|uniref:B-box zinc finger protein 20-like n=1 Tax=Rutidosis leptorrhynchoides TaxID=125765 RepID=UPI003A9A362D